MAWAASPIRAIPPGAVHGPPCRAVWIGHTVHSPASSASFRRAGAVRRMALLQHLRVHLAGPRLGHRIAASEGSEVECGTGADRIGDQVEARREEGRDDAADADRARARLPAGLSARTVLRQATCPEKRLFVSPPTRRRMSDQTPSAPTSSMPVAWLMRPAISIETVTPSGCSVTSRTVAPGHQLDTGLAGDMCQQYALEVGTVGGEVRRFPAPFGCRAELHAAEFGEARRVAQHHGVGPHRGVAKARQHAEAVEDARGVGRQLDAGSDFVEPLARARRRAPDSRAPRRRALPSARQCRRRR